MNLKRLCILLMLNFVISFSSIADCVKGFVSVSPLTSSISSQQHFLIEAYASSKYIVDSMELKHTAYLVSKTDTVHLQVVDICKGVGHISQALLKPAELLKPGKSYKLVIDNLKEDERRYLYAGNRNSSDDTLSLHYHVEENTDFIPPQIVGDASLMDAKWIHHGCHYGQYIRFKTGIQDSSNMFIHVRVEDTLSAYFTEFYYYCPSNGILTQHGGPCFHRLYFDQANTLISFCAIDIHGSLLGKRTKPIFIKYPPFPDD